MDFLYFITSFLTKFLNTKKELTPQRIRTQKWMPIVLVFAMSTLFIHSNVYAQSCTELNSPTSIVTVTDDGSGTNTCLFEVTICITVVASGPKPKDVFFEFNGQTQTVSASGSGFPNGTVVCTSTPFVITASCSSGFLASAIGLVGNGGGSDCDPAYFNVDENGITNATTPVEFAYIKGESKGRYNQLTWATYTEENTQWHYIEASNNGVDRWEVLGKIAAEGFSTELKSYTFEDNNPGTIKYYRVRSLDFDGHIDMSETIYIRRKSIKGALELYPNPTTEQFTLEFDALEEGEITVRIIDAVGRTMNEQSYMTQEGVNILAFDVTNYPQGVYMITIDNQYESINHRMVKN